MAIIPGESLELISLELITAIIPGESLAMITESGTDPTTTLGQSGIVTSADKPHRAHRLKSSI